MPIWPLVAFKAIRWTSYPLSFLKRFTGTWCTPSKIYIQTMRRVILMIEHVMWVTPGNSVMGSSSITRRLLERFSHRSGYLLAASRNVLKRYFNSEYMFDQCYQFWCKPFCGQQIYFIDKRYSFTALTLTLKSILFC